MQCHSCVCILRHAEPKNWFNPDIGRSCIPLQQVKVFFGTVTKYSDILF